MPEIIKRTFEAKRYPRGSAQRALLNLSWITSEYMPSYRFGFDSTRQFRTRSEALASQRQFDARPGNLEQWSGAPDPADPDNYWIDDATGERVNAHTGERHPAPEPTEQGNQ